MTTTTTRIRRMGTGTMTTTRTVLRMRNYECKGMKREIAKEQNYGNHLKVKICSSEKPANILNVSPNYSVSLRSQCFRRVKTRKKISQIINIPREQFFIISELEDHHSHSATLPSLDQMVDSFVRGLWLADAGNDGRGGNDTQMAE